MEFCDKLNILMKITQTTNKRLAAEISVDPSLISLLRNGRRGMPRNREHIKNIAFYFASLCTADYQRKALAEITGIASIGTETPVKVLAMQLERWLTDETDIVDSIIDGLQLDKHIKDEEPASEQKAVSPEKTVFYYGDDGRQEALRHVFSIIDGGPVGIYDNTDLNWAVSDYQFALELIAKIKKHLKNGCTFTQILPPVSRMDSYSESLKFMLPIYASGRAKVYYYPRIQSPPYFHSIIVAPGQCVMCTMGTHTGDAKAITMVSNEKKLVNAHCEQFSDFLSACRPALTVHKGAEYFYPSINELMTMNGAVCQKVAPISTCTMPAELIDICIESIESSPFPEWANAYQKIRNDLPMYEKRFKESPFLDICRLSSAEHVRSGTIPIGSPYMPYEGYPCYTPETYVMHLKNILRLMDEYENYTFLPISAERWPGYNLLVNDGGLALLARGDAPPAMMLEMRRPEMVLACQEHLMRIAEKDGYSGISRDRIRLQINSLIRELQRQ